jgi:hypothetical protein
LHQFAAIRSPSSPGVKVQRISSYFKAFQIKKFRQNATLRAPGYPLGGNSGQASSAAGSRPEAAR